MSEAANGPNLNPDEEAVVDRIFGAGTAHPWSDHMTDEMMAWVDRVALKYLKSKRQIGVVESVISDFSKLLDAVILERFQDLCAADRDIHDNPPYYSADRWPSIELPIIRRVVSWAYGCEDPNGVVRKLHPSG